VPIPTAQEAFTRWQQDALAAVQRYGSGVQNTTKDPTQLAVAQQARLLANFNAVVQSGRWAQALQAVGSAGWKAAVAAKGVTNYQTGVQNAQTKFISAFTPLLAYESTLQGQVDAMPDITDIDRENRMLAWTRGMRAYSGR